MCRSAVLACPIGAGQAHDECRCPTLEDEGARGRIVPRRKILDTWGRGEMDRVLSQMLRQAVWDRLDLLDELTSNADNGSRRLFSPSERV